MRDFRNKVIKNKKFLFTGFVAGLGVTLIIFSVIYLFRLKDKNYKIIDKKNIEAPYYDKSVFKVPLDVAKQKESSSSSETLFKIRLPIIMYHYIEYVKDAGDLIRKKLDITPANFENQLKGLKESGFTTHFVKEVPGILEKKSKLSSEDVILTFDDGYEDFYFDAFPILRKYQMKATIYVVYNFIGRKGYLSENELKEIIASGLIEVGSHTLNHVSLKSSPLSFARKEIFDSKRLLEEKFGINIETFAYPYGAFSQNMIDLVKEASYSAAVSVIPGSFQSAENLFYLSRIRPGILVGQNAGKILDHLK